MASHLQFQYAPFSQSPRNSRTEKVKSRKSLLSLPSLLHNNQATATCKFNGTLYPPKNEICDGESTEKRSNDNRISKMKRVFFLDVNPLCYKGSIPSLNSFAHWISLFFSQVSLTDPVIAVLYFIYAIPKFFDDVDYSDPRGVLFMFSPWSALYKVFDGERGNEYRRQLLPSYKANRRKLSHQFPASQRFPRNSFGRSHTLTLDVLRKCNVPVVKIEGHEADDVVATLVEQVRQRGYRVVIASPDKDFKQLISEDVQIVMPLPELDRWSFYTLKHYIAQYSCDPQSDLSLRCILGDEVDGVPGIQHVVPGFGRKTALKLLKKHGSLDNLLSAAAVRTVGRQYAQEALTKYANFLRRNYEVLSLRKDIDVHVEEQWLSQRDTCNDSVVLGNFLNLLREKQNLSWQNRSHAMG